MLSDNFGRRFNYLRLSITDVCNFRCTYCLPDGYQCEHDRDFLSLSQIKTIASTFSKLGTKKIRITGGEPSLRKDLPQIIQACKTTHGIETVALTTNGYKLTTHIKSWIDAGLDQLNVSIDSLDPNHFQAITGHNKLDEILNGITLAQELGLKKIKVNVVLMRLYAARELNSFLAWIKNTSVTLRFIEVMQTGDNVTFFDEQHVKAGAIKSTLEAEGWLPMIRKHTDGPAQEFYHPEYRGRIGLIMPYSKDFCATCNRLRISALGKLHLCLFSEQGLDLRAIINQGDENLLAENIKALLTDKKATHYLHDRLTGATKNLAMLGG